MINKNTDVDEYLKEVSNHAEILVKLRELFLKNLPEGFEESISDKPEGDGKIIRYVIPLSLYPPGNHEGNPEDPEKKPLGFISMMAQKTHVTVSHRALKSAPFLLQWFVKELEKIEGDEDKKPALGQITIKFKPETRIPEELMASLCRKIYPEEWIDMFQATLK